MKWTTSIGLLAALCCAPPATGSTLLFSRSLVVDRSVNIYETSQFGLKFTFGNSVFSPTNPVTLFDGLTITPASTGQTFVAKAATESNFAAVAQRITDALNENIRLAFTEIASNRPEVRGWAESGFFINHGSPTIPDLAGNQIDEIQLRIDNFSLVFGPAPANPGAATIPPVQLLATFSVYGQVPEPPSIVLSGGSLLAVAVAAYTVARRRRAQEAARVRVPVRRVP
jgi:hypothetical protein